MRERGQLFHVEILANILAHLPFLPCQVRWTTDAARLVFLAIIPRWFGRRRIYRPVRLISRIISNPLQGQGYVLGSSIQQAFDLPVNSTQLRRDGIAARRESGAM